MMQPNDEAVEQRARPKLTRYVIPLVAFVVVAVFLAMGLGLDPRHVPSPLVDKPAPAFSLPILAQQDQGFSPENLKGKVWLLNVWASWCVSCREEHEVITEMVTANKLTVVGLNYKDDPGDAQNWLERFGNPYFLSVMDRVGDVGIDWGVYGVPETFVIDAKGIIRYKHIGPVTLSDVRQKILPLIDIIQNDT